jgi:hypothetical protein
MDSPLPCTYIIVATSLFLLRGIRGEGEREREMGGIWGFVCFTGYLLKGLCGIASAAKILPIAIALAKNAAFYGCLGVLQIIPGLLHTPLLLFVFFFLLNSRMFTSIGRITL